jgi:hypothetical protein
VGEPHRAAEERSMSHKIEHRLEEVMAMIPCPVSGCWFVHGAKTAYYYDDNCECHVLEVWPNRFVESDPPEGNGHEDTEGDILFELAEFDFTELVRVVPLEHFHFSQQRAVFEIGWKEFGQDLELRVHIEPEEADEES